jgi:hypothetical protein
MGILKFWGDARKHTQSDVELHFWVRVMDFWPESPASGVESGNGFPVSFGLVETRNQKSTFLHPRKVPPPGGVPCPLFYAQDAH